MVRPILSQGNELSSMLASIKDSEEEVCRLELCSVLYEWLRVQMYFNLKKVNIVVEIS